MTIGIDGNEANVLTKVGIGQYAYELLMQFSKYQVSGIQYQVYLKDAPNEYMPPENDNWKYVVVKPRKFWTQIGLPFHLYTHKRPDVFFSPTHYAPRFSPVPTAIAIMDVAYHYYPETFKRSDLYQLENWTRYSAQNASKIFTISNATRDDIMNIYQIPQSRIEVIYPGIMVRNTNDMSHTNIADTYSIKNPYILFVGTLQPRKNIVRLFEAFKILKEDRGENKELGDLDLIIVGKKGWLYDEILATPKKLGIEERVKFLDFVPDEDMPQLYKGAECFVLPSLYEGFGLPVLEAMTYECPVVTSNISSLPEAGGDAALYFDPKDPQDIASQIKKVLDDSKLRESMIKKGKIQITKFSWEKTAKATLEVLREVGSENRILKS